MGHVVMPVEKGQVLLINKPLHWTSFDVVKKLRNHLGVKKIGHAGTLDPLATGLLILCTGPMTKQIENFQSLDKTYTGTLVIGQTTPSYDLETEKSTPIATSHIDEEDLQLAAKKLTGTISQIPPAFSAVRVGGSRSYKHARAGREVSLSPRMVEVHSFQIINFDLPGVSFKVRCSKGTYIRSLVNDFGQLLGVGAYLAELKRTRIGQYDLEDALEIEEVTS